MIKLAGDFQRNAAECYERFTNRYLWGDWRRDYFEYHARKSYENARRAMGITEADEQEVQFQ